MNAVEAGLGLVFAVTGQVKREDPEGIWGIGSQCRDLYVLFCLKKEEEESID